MQDEDDTEMEENASSSKTIGKVVAALNQALKPVILEAVAEACSGLSKEVMDSFKPYLKETVSVACGKITTHSNKANGKSEQLVGECKVSVAQLKGMIEALTLKVNSMTAKLDEVGKVVKEKPTTAVQARQACYFCDEEGLILMACPNKICCISCGSDLHRNEKCIHKEANCGKCGLVGHTAQVHHTKVKELRKRLMAAHAEEFDHFLDRDEPGTSAGGPGGPGKGKRLGGRYRPSRSSSLTNFICAAIFSLMKIN